MNEARFWQIISDSRSDFDPELKDGNLDRQAERLARFSESWHPKGSSNLRGISIPSSSMPIGGTFGRLHG